jgi:hypothetical protein
MTNLHPSVKVLLDKPTAEDERAQELLRASFTRANLTEAERLVGRGALLEETAKGNLEAARGKDAAARELAENQLADAMAMQGKYEEAATTHHDRDMRKRYRDTAKAIEQPDEEECNCKPEKARLNDVEIEVPPTNIKQMVYSRRHGDVVALEVCDCGWANARPLTGTLARLSRSQGHDTQVLRANG